LELLPDLDPRQITRTESMKNLGANSIDRVDVIIATMKSLELRFPLTELGGLRNIGELVDNLYTRSLNTPP